jgi:hypothetical protein
MAPERPSDPWRRDIPDEIEASKTSGTYKYRDAGKRRSYMRDYMRKWRSAS